MTLDAIARPPLLVERVCHQLATLIRRDLAEDPAWPEAAEAAMRFHITEAGKDLES